MGRMLKSHGTTVYRISFSKRILCDCKGSKNLCHTCLGTGYKSAIKTQKVILDTIAEINKGSFGTTGYEQGISIRIYSYEEITSGDYIVVRQGTLLEIFKAGSTFVERYAGGDIEAYICGCVKVPELTGIITSVIPNTVTDKWVRL